MKLNNVIAIAEAVYLADVGNKNSEVRSINRIQDNQCPTRTAGVV